LTAVITNLADVDGFNAGNVNYQWTATQNGTTTDLTGENSTTLTLTSDHLNKQIGYNVSYTDEDNHTNSYSSSPTATVWKPVEINAATSTHLDTSEENNLSIDLTAYFTNTNDNDSTSYKITSIPLTTEGVLRYTRDVNNVVIAITDPDTVLSGDQAGTLEFHPVPNYHTEADDVDDVNFTAEAYSGGQPGPGLTSDELTINITIASVEDFPNIVQASYTTPEYSVFSERITVNDPDIITDDDDVLLEIVPGSYTLNNIFPQLEQVEWLSLTAESGTVGEPTRFILSGTPDYRHVGINRITLRATDNYNNQSEIVVDVTVLNINPTFSFVASGDGVETLPNVISVPENKTYVGNFVSGLVLANDEMNKNGSRDPVTWSLIEGDDDASFNIDSDGVLSFNSPADFESRTQYTVTVKATDIYGSILEKGFTILIGNAPDTLPPVFMSSSFENAVPLSQNAAGTEYMHTVYWGTSENDKYTSYNQDVYQLNASDPLESETSTISYSIDGNHADASRFSLTNTNMVKFNDKASLIHSQKIFVVYIVARDDSNNESTLKLSLNTTNASLYGTACFTGDAKVKTDQGVMRIEDVSVKNTINNKKIRGISETIYTQDKIIAIEKDAFGVNKPSRKTLVAPYHRFVVNNRLVKAQDLVNDETVYFTKYRNQVLYNIILKEHSTMIVNNVRVETLDPNTLIAKVFDGTIKGEQKIKVMKSLNAYHKKLKSDPNKTIGHYRV
jgi:hypothetical protein